MSTERESVRWQVPVGDAATSALYESPIAPSNGAVLVLGHSSGGHVEFRTMNSLAAEFRSRGFGVVRFNFLYRELQKGPPDRMPRLTECFAAVADSVREQFPAQTVLLGGHSMGGRASSVLASEGYACCGLVLLAYPLHPAGQPEKLRDEHLPRIPVPVLCLNGTRDDLCQRELMDPIVARLPATWTMHWLEGADHSFHVQKRSGRTEEDVYREIGDTTAGWLRDLPG